MVSHSAPAKGGCLSVFKKLSVFVVAATFSLGGFFALNSAKAVGVELSIPNSITIGVSSLIDTDEKTQLEVNAAVEEAITGKTSVSVSLTNNSEELIDAVRIDPINAGSNLQFWAKDTANNWYNVNIAGWGPEAGFALPVGYTATTNIFILSLSLTCIKSFNLVGLIYRHHEICSSHLKLLLEN